MVLKRAFTLFTAGIMMAGMIAATGSMGAAAAENISEAGAEEIALKDAGVGAAEITFDRVERGTEQGVSVYEIEFSTADKEYDYDISIADGEIVKESWELIFPSAGGSQISEAEARQRATIAAGVEGKNVTFTRIERSTEDGIPVYELEFENETREFEYVVARTGGKILNASGKVKVPAYRKGV